MPLTTTQSLREPRFPRCDLCGDRVPVRFPDAQGRLCCRKCFIQPAHDLIRHEAEG